MYYFALYTSVTLPDKPQWLDEFKNTYGAPFDYHVTLKQPCYVEEIDIEQLKQCVRDFFSLQKINKIQVEFTELYLDDPLDGKDDGFVMLGTSQAAELFQLQKDLVNHLNEYRNYLEPRFKGYEEDFMPHITIGYELTAERYKEAIAALPQDIRVRGVIEEVVLAIVPNASEIARKDPGNLTVYSLNHF